MHCLVHLACGARIGICLVDVDIVARLVLVTHVGGELRPGSPVVERALSQCVSVGRRVFKGGVGAFDQRALVDLRHHDLICRAAQHAGAVARLRCCERRLAKVIGLVPLYAILSLFFVVE